MVKKAAAEKKKKQKLGPKQKKWIKALESGDYKQGKSYLHTTENKFCCLGVACHLFAEDAKIKVKQGDGTFDYGGEKGKYLSGTLPSKMITFLGFRDRFGQFYKFSNYDIYGSLSNMNDSGVSFEEIAAFVKKDPSLVFKKEV